MTPRSEPDTEPTPDTEPDRDLIEVGLTIATCITFARMVSVQHAEAYAAAAVSEQSRVHTLGPILDPTAYRREGPNADRTSKVARAFYELRLAIEEATDAAHR